MGKLGQAQSVEFFSMCMHECGCALPTVCFWGPEMDAASLPLVLSTSGSLIGTLLPLLLALELEKADTEPGLVCGHKGFELHSSCLHRKHFTHRARSPALGVRFLFSAQLDALSWWCLRSKMLSRLL